MAIPAVQLPGMRALVIEAAMLAWVRKLLENWVARGFFAFLIVIFVFWGISNVVTLIGNNTTVATVGGQKIDLATVQAVYQTSLSQAQQVGQPVTDPAAKQQLAAQALDSVLRKVLLQREEKRLGVSAPDSAIRDAIGKIPAFQTDGKFDQAKFTSVLAQNSLTPARFLVDVKDSIASRQITQALASGAAASAPLVTSVFNYVAEQRFAETTMIPFAAQPAPAAPDTDVLQRYWRNHQADFTAPEYRKIQVVVLSPALLAAKESVSQPEIDSAYQRITANQPKVDLRSVQVIAAPNLAASSRLQAAWQGGDDWAAIQAMAKRFGATSLEIPNTEQAGIPSATLADAVFHAPVGTVTGPIAGGSDLYVFKVTAVSNGAADEQTLKTQIASQLQLQKAQALVAQNVDKLQDALAGQAPLDKLPGDLGLVAVQGTLDSSGVTPDGNAAPIPGGNDLRAAILKAAFAAKPNAPAQLNNGPNGSYYALTVDAVTPPSPQPFEQVHAKVLAAWKASEISREAEVKASALLAAVNGGQSFDTAASNAGDAVTTTPPITRTASPNATTAQLQQILFSLKQGQATMLQTKDGFEVAALTKIIHPDPAADSSDSAQVSQGLAKGLQNDLESSFIAALQDHDKVTIDQKLVAQIVQ